VKARSFADPRTSDRFGDAVAAELESKGPLAGSGSPHRLSLLGTRRFPWRLEANLDMTRFLTMACAGAIGVLLASPALAQQGRASGRVAVSAPAANPAPVIVYRGSSSARVYSGHPHGGPPGQ
jgi:hypothetical protein